MFFSEEKNQKTFFPALPIDPGHGLSTGIWRRNKSLLLLFFRKEDSSLLPGQTPTDLEE